MAAVNRWCEERGVECLYLLAEAEHQETIRLAEEHDFRLVDLRITLQSQLHPPLASRPGSVRIRLARLEDLAGLRTIARSSYRDSRFYADGHFLPSACDRLYEIWIEKSCSGYADAVLVAEVDAQPAGYVTCHAKESEHGEIGLVGVSPDYRQQGLGRQLVEAACRWFAERSLCHVTVVTQGRNISAQRLYQRCGFVTKAIQLWYHRWNDSAKAKEAA